MSRSDHSSSAHLTFPSYSRPASKAVSIDQDLVTHVKPRSMTTATLNVLFLGETNIGESSIAELIAGPGGQRRTSRHAGLRVLGDDVRNVTLDGKIFKLHASPTSESMTPVALREGIQNTMTDLRRNGGIHLLVYCMNALHSTLWIHEIHSTVASNSTLSSRIPAVAVVAGMSDVAQRESWWSNIEGTLANQGLRFDDHAFIRMMTTGAQSPAGDHISQSRRVLHALILHNCAYGPNSEADSDTQLTAPYKQQSAGHSFQSLYAMSAGKPSSHTSASSKAIDIVLLGDIGVGKSSLINLITKEKVAEVSSDTIGCTKIAAKYTFEGRGRTFHLYDTPGLVDPQMGIRPFVDPIDTIQKLIRSLGDGDGPDLLLFCIDNSKPTLALRRNYRLFFRIICQGKVPFALAITKLEDGQGANQWWSRHGATIRSYGIDCSGHVGIGHERRRLDPNPDSEGQLRESLLSFFITCADRQKHRTSSLLFSVGRILGSATFFLRSQVLTVERTLMSQCGLERRTARELADRLVSLKQSHSDVVRTQ